MSHLNVANRILWYLKGKPAQGLFYSSNVGTEIQAYTDADWGNYKESRSSITGFFIFLGDSLVSWKSKKQNTISNSSTEGEYKAMSLATTEIQWILYLVRDFKVKHDKPSIMNCDNISAMHIAKTAVFQERIKHFEIDITHLKIPIFE